MEILQHLFDFVRLVFDIFLHLDVYLNLWTIQLGVWFYAILFLVIFCETGLVVTPFLPGDSLLFAVGALAAIDGSPLTLSGLFFTLCLAGILGDNTNYFLGRKFGPKVFHAERSLLFNRKYLDRAQIFYEKHGRKTLILARFVPIIRTFAPFVAGIGKMHYTRFLSYSLIAGISWVSIFVTAGYYFGNQEWVKRQFHLVIVVIILISVMPMVIEVLRARRSSPE